MAKRNLYLSNVPAEDALSKYLAALDGLLTPQYETVLVQDALDRVTKSAVYACCCSPLFNAAAMDGIAVVAASTNAAKETAPLTLIRGRDFAVVDTGDPIHPPYDAVIMAEDTVELDEDTVQILSAAASWQHIRPIGEDIVTGEMLIPGRHKIRPIDIGVLLSGGITQAEVYKKPRVALIPTGSEIIEPTEIPEDGQIIESNTRMFEAMVTKNGGIGERFAPLPDDYDLLKKTIRDAADNYDLVLVNAGSSAGTEDFTVHILRDLGEVVVHGVAIKPGKPVILAVVSGKPVLGIPGYPVSAWLAYENFAEPVLSILSGRRDKSVQTVDAVIAKRLVSSLKHREYVRVKVGRVNGNLVASPLARGAGAAMSLVRADGFCIIPQNSEGVEAGDTVRVELYRSLSEIENTVVAIGSHDLILDVLSDLMAGTQNAYLSSTHVGSLAGLMALKRGEAHISPIHLLDENSGRYNVSYLRQLFPDAPMALIKGVGRIQGLIVKKGNPLDIQAIDDLINHRYVNRQRGAGTRILLDYQLKQAGISTGQINGYDREAATHMAVAAAVASGSADAGMGISAAAKALELGFIPVGTEEYDFAVPVRFLDLAQVQIFLEMLKNKVFHQRLDDIGGYTYDRCGEVIRIG